MPSSTADRNLLFGILALQMDFISRDQLVGAMNVWVLEKQNPLGEILVKQGHLAVGRHTLLEALVQEHLKQHNNSPRQSLAAVSSIKSVREDLDKLSDSDIAASLVHVSQNPAPIEDPYATQAGTVGEATSKGTRFRILRPHAIGGLGQVWVALDEELHREVALKEIQPSHAHREESRGRFMVEAEVTGGLEHPGIVPVYGLGTYADGRPYYAMRFIRGDSLETALEKYHAANWSGRDSDRALELRKLLGRFVDVCNAIAYAHSRGVLHRDLKPGNVMLGNYGETLVVDWGLAKVLGHQEQTIDPKERPLTVSGSGSSPTLAGSALGTPAYMSPEQAEGRHEELGPATDVYSLGATLYHILTGKPPIESQDIGEILVRTVKGEIPSPRQINSQIPKPLAAICQQAMSVKPQDRYPSPRVLAEDVEKYLADEPVTAHKDSFPARVGRLTRRHRGAVLATGAALFLVATIASVAAVLINNQRIENAKLANKEEQARKQAEGLTEKEELARKKADRFAMEEAASRLKAEQNSLRAKTALARYHFSHGLSEYEAGRTQTALKELWRAWAVCPPENPQRNGYWEVLINRATIQGQSVMFPLPHDNSLIATAYSPDGTRLVTMDEKSAWLWDAQTGKPLGKPMPHNLKFGAEVRFSPDGLKVIAKDHVEKRSIVWDAQSGSRLEAEVLQNDLFGLATINHDGTRGVLGSYSQTAQLWDIIKGVPIGKEMSHEDMILRSAFSADDSRVLIESYHSARVWDAKTGEPLTSSMKHEDVLLYATMSLDNTRIVTVSKDHQWRLWDGKTGVLIVQPQLYGINREGFLNIAPTRIRFSPDSTRFLTCYKNKAGIWDAKTGTPVGETMVHDSEITRSMFSPDGSQVLTVSADNSARHWNAHTGVLIGQPMVHDAPIRAAVFNPDGMTLLTGSEDKTARLWDAKTGDSLEEPLLHAEQVQDVAFSSDGFHFLTSCADNSVRLWTSFSRRPPTTELSPKSDIQELTFSPAGTRVLTLSKDSNLRLWDAKSGKLLGKPIPQKGAVCPYTFSPDGSRLLTANKENSLQLWNVQTGAVMGEPMPHEVFVDKAWFNSDGTRILSIDYTEPQSARLWDAKTGQILGQPIPHQGRSSNMSFSPDGKRILAVTEKNTAQLFDAQDGQSFGDPMPHQDSIIFAVFSPDGARVLTHGKDSIATLWDAKTGTFLVNLTLHHAPAKDVEIMFCLDGKRILTYDSATCCVCDVKTGKPILKSIPFQGFIGRNQISPDQSLILSTQEETAQIWDLKKGVPIGKPLRHQALIRNCNFSPDSTRIVTVSIDKTARIWDASTGTPLSEPMHHESQITEIRFTPDSTNILTTSKDNNISKLWDAWTGVLLDKPFSNHENQFGTFGTLENPRVFSPDSTKLLTNESNMVKIWDIGSRNLPNKSPGQHHFLEILTNAVLPVDPTGPVLPLRHQELIEKWNALEKEDQAFLKSLREHSRQKKISAHRHAASQAEEAENWFAADFHLKRLTTLLPNNVELALRHVTTLAELSRWREAELLLAPLAARNPDQSSYQYGLILAALGENDRFQQHCQAWRKRLGKETDGKTADEVAWLATLFPQAGTKPSPWRELAQQAVKSEPESWEYQETLGAAWYREGEFQKAVDQLEEAISQRKKDGATVWMRIFLAMAHHRLNHAEDARKWHAKAVEQIEEQSKSNNSDWQERLRHELLLRELEGLLKPKPDLEK